MGRKKKWLGCHGNCSRLGLDCYEDGAVQGCIKLLRNTDGMTSEAVVGTKHLWEGADFMNTIQSINAKMPVFQVSLVWSCL